MITTITATNTARRPRLSLLFAAPGAPPAVHEERPSPSLSTRELRRIVAEMVG